jgi:hypothetical protein
LGYAARLMRRDARSADRTRHASGSIAAQRRPDQRSVSDRQSAASTPARLVIDS